MDILYKGNVDCFCLATSDSDFTNLAMRFRNDNIVVIGAGEQKTPTSFRKACDIFIPIDELLNAKQAPAAQKQSTKKANVSNTDKKKEKIIKMATQIIEDGDDADGWMHFSAFMNEIHRKENDFNPILYGAQSGKPIPFFKSLTKNGKPIFILERIDKIDKIKINK